MRIIAGQRRGHKIDGPTGRDVRPTSDFVREAIFNILRDRVEDRAVYDVFAGTGALGLEALSRGASRAIFVERDRDAIGLIRRNLAALRYEHRGGIVPIDAYRLARTLRLTGSEPVVVFIDPPYREFDSRPERAREMLAHLASKLPDGSILVVESGQPLGEAILPEPERWDQRKYGGTHVAILHVGETSDTLTGAELLDPDTVDDSLHDDADTTA